MASRTGRSSVGSEARTTITPGDAGALFPEATL
jgi:hypothetical protein